MFWNKIKSKEYLELFDLISRTSVRLSALEIDLQLYVKKLKASKALRTVKEELEEEEQRITKDLYGGMFLPDDVKVGGIRK